MKFPSLSSRVPLPLLSERIAADGEHTANKNVTLSRIRSVVTAAIYEHCGSLDCPITVDDTVNDGRRVRLLKNNSLFAELDLTRITNQSELQAAVRSAIYWAPVRQVAAATRAVLSSIIPSGLVRRAPQTMPVATVNAE